MTNAIPCRPPCGSPSADRCSSFLCPDAKTLDTNADWLKANPNQLVRKDGNCDERGTNEYNLALGERRTKAAMSSLVSKGIAADRITVVSYGTERPVCTKHNASR